MKQYQDFLAKYLWPRWRNVTLLFIVLLMGTGLELLSPFIIARFIDAALAGESLERLMTLALIFLLLASISQVSSIAETYLASDLGLQATNELRADLAQHCLKLDLSFHHSRSPGELIERVDGDVGNLNNFFSRFVVDLLGNGVLLLGILISLFSLDWRLGTALSGFVLISILLIYSMRNLGIPYFMAASEARAKMFGFLEERLAGSEDIRPNGGVAYVLRRFFDHARLHFRKFIQANLIGTVMFGSSMILFAIGSALALGLGAYLYLQSLVSLGTIFMIFRYTELLTRPIEVLGRQLQDLQEAGASVLRIRELLDTKTKVLDDGPQEVPASALTLSFDRVSFYYPDTDKDPQAALKDLSFSLEPGKKLGLLGRTGSGKTTLSRLLFRFYDPSQGQILLNGTDLKTFRLASLNERIALVTQDIQLFHASLRNNLSLFKTTISDERLLAALRSVGLWDWYQSLDKGLDSWLEPNSSLSAGQAQLLTLARVFLKDPGLIILDEASSRLDPATEEQLDKALEKLLDGRTAIIIAHRLKTVERVDEIMILEGGRCIEKGERERLQQSASRFAELLKSGLEEALT